MKVLVIGSGGREHTLVWKLAQSPQVEKIYAIPGNPGMAALAECVSGVYISDNEAIVRFAKAQAIDLVVVGPEMPLTNGVVDALAAAGVKAFGPSKAAARIEGSKAFSKQLMQKYGIPTAKYAVFTDAAAARAYVRQEGVPIVVKADGLAAGKGVIVAMTLDEALAAVDDILCGHAFGSAGSRVVIEEFMAGEEASLLAFTDGETVVPMISSQDHKRVFDGDKGPNTGGMGTYAPAPVITPEILRRVRAEILEPAVAAMRAEGCKYVGCLYAGLMITAEGPKVVEFNARFGDPETQVVLPLLEGDLAEIMLACVDGALREDMARWKDEAAVCVVLAAGGYPASYRKSDAIDGLEAAAENGALVFHAGTAEADGKIVTNGGRVLGVTATAPDVAEAVRRAYAAVDKIRFDDCYYRKDIAHRAIRRQP